MYVVSAVGNVKQDEGRRVLRGWGGWADPLPPWSEESSEEVTF